MTKTGETRNAYGIVAVKALGKNQSLRPGGQLKRNLGWTADGSGVGSCVMENSRISGVNAERMLLRCSL